MPIKDVWKRVVKATRGKYGETDYNKKTITVNKKIHKSKSHGSGIKKNKDGTANILDTIVHEEMHRIHPKMHEKTVRKITPKKVKSMSKKVKNKMYSRYK